MGNPILRVGAAAFALGLSLAGPVPSALAEGGEQTAPSAESPAASSSRADVAGPEPSLAQRPAGPAAQVEAALDLSTRTTQSALSGAVAAPAATQRTHRGEGPGTSRAALRAADPRAATSAPASVVRVGQVQAAAPISAAELNPSAAAAVDSSFRPPAGVGAASAASVIADPSPARPSAPVVRSSARGQSLAYPSGQVTAFLDRVERWLSSLPPGPLTEGALLLVRRALGNPVGAGVKGVKVELVNKTDLPITFGEGPRDDLAKAGYLFYRLEPGQSKIFAHEYGFTNDWDVQLVVGNNNYQPRMLVKARNSWAAPPELVLNASPREDVDLKQGQLYNTAYRAMYYHDGWLYDSWELLAENTGCHCDASNSGGPSQGGMRVYVTRLPDEEDYKSFIVAIYELPSANLVSDLGSPPFDKKDFRVPYYYCGGNGKYDRADQGRG